MRFAEWIEEGPGGGLKRQHSLSRTATGWIPGKDPRREKVNLSELDDLEGLSQEQLRSALAYSPDVTPPLAAQNAANSERKSWGAQWASESQHDELAWPEEIEQLPPMPCPGCKRLLSLAQGATCR